MKFKITWDYTQLAKYYEKRSDYSEEAILFSLKKMRNFEKFSICDIGAGTGKLTKILSKYSKNVDAIEPNAEMMKFGKKECSNLNNIKWYYGQAEKTNRENKEYDLVTFGSSFNVCDQKIALKEVKRILKTKGWFLCCWNNRNLDCPIQKGIEKIITSKISNFDYGSRRKDQKLILEKSKIFNEINFFSKKILYKLTRENFVEAFKSHATIKKQSKNNFAKIIREIDLYLKSLGNLKLTIEYKTNVWFAQLR